MVHLKRLGIFLCFDVEGIIDDYIIYLLDDICENLDELFIVSNGDLTKESQKKLEKYTTSDILFRSNIGFDAGAWRDVMVDCYGFDKLCEFDELILFNDSFFGPIYPFKIMFEQMDKEDIDFWGITNHGEAPDPRNLCPYENRPRYIQTYFMAFRNNLIKSEEFQNYWTELPDYETFDELAFKHGAVLTQYFSDLGYKWKSYVYTLDMEDTIENAMSFHTFDMYNLVVNRDLPILKRKAFKLPRELHLRYNMASDLSRTIDYIKYNTDYDVSLIFKYFLRIMDPNELLDILNLVKIFPKKQLKTDFKTDKKVLLIAHLFFDDIWEYAFDYLLNVPEYIDILITTDTYEKKEFFEENISKNLKNNVNVIKIEPRGRDMSSLFVASREIVKKYDYFCFMHDKKSKGAGFITVGATFRDVLWENSLASPEYINSIVSELDENDSLGLIVPPRVYHGPYFKSYINNYWVKNFEFCLNLLNQMGIVTPISKKYPPLVIGNCFWAKYDAVEPIFDLYLEYDDFPEEPMPGDGTISHALERVYGYVAASRGYYTEIVMTDDYARSDLLNFNHMFHQTVENMDENNLISKKTRTFFTFNNSLNKLFKKLNNK